MDLNTLRAFVKIAEKNTYRSTADYFGISQSTLSKNIAELENEIGVPLFDRNKRVAVLTPAGEYFYSKLFPFFRKYDNLLQQTLPFSANKVIRVCAIPAVRTLNLGNLFLQFETLHPDYSITVDKAATFSSVAYQLERGTYAFALMHQPFVNHFHYDISFLCDDELVAVLPADHTLAKEEAIHFEALQNDTFLLNESILAILPQVAAITGCTPNHICQLDSRESIISGITNGLGISLMFQRSISTFHTDNLTIKPIAGLPHTPIVFVSSFDQTLTDYQQELKDFLIQNLATNKE